VTFEAAIHCGFDLARCECYLLMALVNDLILMTSCVQSGLVFIRLFH